MWWYSLWTYISFSKTTLHDKSDTFSFLLAFLKASSLLWSWAWTKSSAGGECYLFDSSWKRHFVHYYSSLKQAATVLLMLSLKHLSCASSHWLTWVFYAFTDKWHRSSQHMSIPQQIGFVRKLRRVWMIPKQLHKKPFLAPYSSPQCSCRVSILFLRSSRRVRRCAKVAERKDKEGSSNFAINVLMPKTIVYK